MEILFVVTSIPFPARQGVELPLANLIDHFSKEHTIDIVVIARNQDERDDFQERLRNVPGRIRNVNIINVIPRQPIVTTFREIFGLAPYFFQDHFRPEDLSRLFAGRKYDFIWVSPLGALGLVLTSRRLGLLPHSKIAIGQSDVMTSVFWSNFKAAMLGRWGFDFRRLSWGFRIPAIWFYERRYWRLADLIHLQTDLEVHRALRLFGEVTAAKAVYAPNGKNKKLEAVGSVVENSKQVLYMTHLAAGRENESRWFLKRVWPRVVERVPDAELLLVGTPPDNEEAFKRGSPRNSQICGHVEDLASVFSMVALSVVPTLHDCGWINRIADSLVAAVPVVACSEPLATVPGLQIGVHALKGDTEEEFAMNVVKILNDPTLRAKLSTNARDLGCRLPTWEQTASKIEAALERLSE